MAMTMSGTTLTFNDSTTQTTSAVYPPTWLGVGSMAILACTTSGLCLPGDTGSGSYLFRQTTAGSFYMVAGYVHYGSGNVVNNTTSFTGAVGGGGSTFTSVGGTWRNLQWARNATSSYDGYQNYTTMGVMFGIRTA